MFSSLYSQREDFQKAIARLHAHPTVGKNYLDSFLALPMQRLTRLKLLVEVIQKLQLSVTKDAEENPISGSTETMTPASERAKRMTITAEQREHVSIALKELKRVSLTFQVFVIQPEINECLLRWHKYLSE